MLTAFLQFHPMRELLADGTRVLYPPAGDRKAWDGIPGEYRQEIRAMAEAYAKIPYPLRSASGFLAFVRSGDRQADEQPYFARRRKLCAAVLEACVSDTLTDDVVDGIWLLCEETSWVISAHNINPVPGAPAPADCPLPDPRKPYIDLFSAQTGMILSLASSLLEKHLDRVSPMIRVRIAEEIRRRILCPFMETDDFWWMGFRRKDLNNWTPWILSNVLVCAVLSPMGAEELSLLLTRACGMLDRYLAVLPEDGGCDEGAGYWNMAGGALLDCLELLEKVTGMSFRTEGKIRNVLRFPLAASMGNGWFANFADCDARPFISGERMETAGRMIGDPALTALGARMRGTVADQLEDTPHLTRALDLLFHAPAPEGFSDTGVGLGDTWLKDLQLRRIRRGRWLLACKGGHNGENHNHNDVGSFILMQDGEPAVVDAGNMLYSAKTFSRERYTLWNVRADWHNLPVIGDAVQQEGPEHAAREVKCTPDGLELNLEAAYGADAGVGRLKRTFALSAEGLRLADDGELLSAQAVTWVFLLRSRPVWENGSITAGNLEIRCPEGLSFTAEEKPVTDPRMARSWPGSLWRVMLKSEKTAHFRGTFVFSSRKREE